MIFSWLKNQRRNDAVIALLTVESGRSSFSLAQAFTPGKRKATISNSSPFKGLSPGRELIGVKRRSRGKPLEGAGESRRGQRDPGVNAWARERIQEMYARSVSGGPP
jgi:hypothetical protein